MHCASAWSAIHACFLANARRGTLAGFCAGQSSGCVFSERLRHRRLQKRAGHALEVVPDVVGHCRMREEEEERLWLVRGVVQWAHARDVSCRSYISLLKENEKIGVWRMKRMERGS